MNATLLLAEWFEVLSDNSCEVALITFVVDYQVGVSGNHGKLNKVDWKKITLNDHMV